MHCRIHCRIVLGAPNAHTGVGNAVTPPISKGKTWAVDAYIP